MGPFARLAAVLPLVLGLAGCIGSSDFRAPVFEGGQEVANTTAPGSAPSVPGRIYIVQRGDTLYSIAWRENLDYRALASWNRLPSTYTIHPGQSLRLTPSSDVAYGATAPQSSGPERGSAAPAATAARTSTSYRDDNEPINSNMRWRWPTNGQVVSSYSEGDIGRKGILISGNEGQPVQAAENGRVVYGGIGLKGYGRLIIVKHDKYYLSAYGHNRKILVKEGDTVTAGQQIAEMGRAGRDQPMLHFEIRYQGKPVNPAKLLPPL